MAEITLTENQAAVILTAGEEGDIEVDVAYDGEEGLAGQICKAMAMKLLEDDVFRDDLLSRVAENLEAE